MISNLSGHYNNSLKSLSFTVANLADELAWMVQNKLNPTGWDYHPLYLGSVLKSSSFPQFVLDCYNAKILLGFAFSAISEVDAAIAYNAKQTDPRKRLVFGVTEYEDYNAGTPAGYIALMSTAKPKLKAANMLLVTYQGWTHEWPSVIQYCDSLFLHSYISSANMATPDGLFNYMKGRLATLAAEAKKQGKIFPFSLLTSSETAYGAAFFKSNSWAKAYALFLSSWNRNATADMKAWLVPNGHQVFVSKLSKVCKPLVK